MNDSDGDGGDQVGVTQLMMEVVQLAYLSGVHQMETLYFQLQFLGRISVSSL